MITEYIEGLKYLFDTLWKNGINRTELVFFSASSNAFHLPTYIFQVSMLTMSSWLLKLHIDYINIANFETELN